MLIIVKETRLLLHTKSDPKRPDPLNIQELEKLVSSRREEIDQLKSTISLKELELESLVEELEKAKAWACICICSA